MLDFFVHVRDHLTLSAAALAVALLVGLPLGVAIATLPRLRDVSLAAIYVARVVPSLAVLALMLPLIGIGFAPSLVALTLLAIPPIALGTEIGLAACRNRCATRPRPRHERPSDPPARGLAARAPRRVRRHSHGRRRGDRERHPGRVPSAAAGLGEYIVNGIEANDRAETLEGAVAVGILALATQAALGAIERRLAANR